MDIFNNFNDLFKSQSTNTNNCSIFNELLPELKQDVVDTFRCRINQIIATDYNVKNTDDNYDKYVNEELDIQIDGGCPEVLEVIKSYTNSKRDCEELLNDLGIDPLKTFQNSDEFGEYIDDCENDFYSNYSDYFDDPDDEDGESTFDKAMDEYLEECSNTVPDDYLKKLAKSSLIDYFFYDHAQETKQQALELIKKDGPNYY